MTPQEKATQLVASFSQETPRSMDNHHAKRCGLICVDEIGVFIVRNTPKDDPYANVMALEYWQKVKEEINKL